MRIGIIGAGQLGQMLGFAAQALGDNCQFIDPSEAPPAAVAGPVLRAAFDDLAALASLAESCDVVTYEFENVSLESLLSISDRVRIYPPPAALGYAQDRLLEKQLFDNLDIPRPAYRGVDSIDGLRSAISEIGLPLVAKTRRLGYDGKGQYLLRQAGQVDDAWRLLNGSELIAEQWIDFDYEVSAIGARDANGEIVHYPLTHNEHAGGILHVSRAPVDDPDLTGRAEDYVRRLLAELNYVGVLALEFFVAGNELLANEFAPRVHNSGHWTIEGANTSQFSNHLRAISNRPLKPAGAIGHAGMRNLIGNIPDSVRHLEHGELHDYGKAARPGRKLGHLTVVADSAAERDRLLADIESAVTNCTGRSETAP